MGDLAAAEADGELHLVAAFDEAARGAHLEVEIVVVGLRAELDLLYFDDALLALRLALLLLFLVLELAVVEDLADWRNRLGVDLDEIHPLVTSALDRFRRRQHTKHFTVRIDDPYFGYADSVAHAMLRFASRFAGIKSSKRHIELGVLLVRSKKGVGLAERIVGPNHPIPLLEIQVAADSRQGRRRTLGRKLVREGLERHHLEVLVEVAGPR